MISVEVNPGDLRHVVTVQRNVGTGQDDFGQPNESWLTIATVHASIQPLGGRELFWAMQVAAEATHQVIMRYDPAVLITEKDRIDFKGRTFQIINVNNIEERNRLWQILCKEVK